MNKIIIIAGLLIMAGIMAISCCRRKEKKVVQPQIVPQIENVEWSKNAVIYEVNIRQYTPEGTFKAFEEHLPRLKEMGVDILWIMPVHPIGQKERKGKLGSYYSVKDYTGINPEFGTLDDFKNLVQEAHNLDMYVILDWVANHTAWDNKLIDKHPDWYKKDSLGDFISPFDWTDVVQLDYDNSGLRKYMIKALKYWVKEADIDGYRCDVAGMVPVNFWEEARTELNKIKPVFMLAENEDVPELLVNAFDMNYAWHLHHIMNEVVKKKANADTIRKYFRNEEKTFDQKAYRMHFITNHDENSWNGTVKERLAEANKVMSVLYFTIPGMPLIYSGQEAGIDKRLRFFDKDTIDWSDLSLTSFYTQLIDLKKENEALWNGRFGGSFEIMQNTFPRKVLVYLREKEDNKLLIVLNLTPKPQTIQIKTKEAFGDYTGYFSKETVTIGRKQNIQLPAWGYKVFIAKIKYD